MLPSVLQVLADLASKQEVGILHAFVNADVVSSLSPPASAINDKSGTVDIVTGITEQVNGSVGNITAASPSATGNGLGHLLLVDSAAGKTLHTLSALDSTGSNHVGSDTVRAVFERNAGHEGIHGGLGSGHMGLQGHACVVEGSGNRDDTTASKTIGVGVRVPGSGLDEVRDGGLDGVEGTNGVDVDDSLEGVGTQAGNGSNEVSSSTSDDKVDGSQLLDAALSGRLEVIEL